MSLTRRQAIAVGACACAGTASNIGATARVISADFKNNTDFMDPTFLDFPRPSRGCTILLPPRREGWP